MVTSEEENKALKMELQRTVQNIDVVKKVVCGWGGVSTPETNKMKCESSDHQRRKIL